MHVTLTSLPSQYLKETMGPQAIVLKESDVYSYKSDLESDPFGRPLWLLDGMYACKIM